MKRLALACLLVLYAFVAFTSWGYDDELVNIDLVESGKSVLEIVRVANATDVHPPGSYLLNKWLFALLRDWSLVRVAHALLAAISIGWVWVVASKRSAHAAVAFLFICLNPTLLLWTTGLRWYAYCVPLLNFLLLWTIAGIERKATFWGVFFLITVVVFHIGYVSLVVVPALFVVAAHRRRARLRSELPTIAWTSVLALAICGPQLRAFATVHMQNSASQVSSYVRSAAGLLLHTFAGQGAYPSTVAGMALIAGNLLLVGAALARPAAALESPGARVLVLGSIGLLAVRLTAKFRNLVVLSTAQGLFQARAFGLLRARWLQAAVLSCFVVGNAWGTWNVITHHGTTKGSWNMPYGEILGAIREGAAHCGTSVLVTSDPVVAHHAKRLVRKVVDLHAGEQWAEEIAPSDECVLALKTFRGALPRETYQRYLDFLAAEARHPTQVTKLGYDANAAFKRRFDADVPDYYAELVVIDRTRLLEAPEPRRDP